MASKKLQHSPGHVYVIDVGNGCCKIGASSVPSERIKSLECASPDRFDRFFVSDRVIGYMMLETAVHQCLKHKNRRNEVFEINFNEAVEVVREVALTFGKADENSPSSHQVLKHSLAERVRERIRQMDSSKNIADRIGISESDLSKFLSVGISKLGLLLDEIGLEVNDAGEVEDLKRVLKRYL